ncbi:MAG: hypothetical protein IJ646_00915 [Clostridia bacterium]|nr:hypothetical protein [Clostridia bacterium]
MEQEQMEVRADAVVADGDWQAKYEALKREFDAYKAEVEGRELARKLRAAYVKLLEGERVDPRRYAAILRATPLDDLRLTEDGQLEDAAALAEAIRRDWGDFIVTQETRGAAVERPPVGGRPVRTKAEILAMRDAVERQRAIAENHELFGF